MNEQAYLRPATYIDSDAAPVVEFAKDTADGSGDQVEAARRLYYAVRDGIVYDPYAAFESPDSYRASACLAAGSGFCIPKAALLAAAARALGIPARVGYADVRNHLASPRLMEMVGGEVFTWHGYTDLFLDGKWVKATPAFNLSMCERFRVKPLEFDGREDSLLHSFDEDDRRHMEYVGERGTFADVPMEEIVATFRRVHPGLFGDGALGGDEDFAAYSRAR